MHYEVRRFYESWEVRNIQTGALVGRYAQRQVAETVRARREAGLPAELPVERAV